MGKVREKYLDEIKGVSVLLVVFCHYVLIPRDSITGNVMMLIAWGAVPCFFMVTGGVLHNSTVFSWKKWGYRLFRTYMVLTVWKIIYFFYFWLLNPFSFSKSQLVHYLFFLGEIDHVSVGLLWFMYAYLMAVFFLPVSHFLFYSGKKGEQILAFVAVMVGVGGLCIPSVNMMLGLVAKTIGKMPCDITTLIQVIPMGSSWKNMLFYFVSGAFLFRYHEQIKMWISEKRWRHGIALWMMLVGIIGLMAIKYFQTAIICWEGIYLKNGYDWISTGFLSIGIYVFFMKREHTCILDRCLQYIGRNTMGIYYMHWILCDAFWKLWDIKFAGHYSVFYNLLKTGMIASICIFSVEIAKKIPGIRELV